MAEENVTPQEQAESKVEALLFGSAAENIEPAETVEDNDTQEAAPIETEADESTEEQEATDETVEAEEPVAETVEIEVDGELLEVPAKYKDHFMRTADYTQKTQEVAAQRKAIEVQQGEVEVLQQQYKFAQEIQPDLMKIEQLKAQQEQARQYLRDNVDSLSSTEIEKIRIAIEDSGREHDELIQGLQGKTQTFQQAQEQARAELLKKGTEVLRARIPSWGTEAEKQVVEQGLASGFTEQELKTVIDPRQIETLWKAAQYDRLQQGKTAAVKKVQSAPPIKAKARNPMPPETRRKLDTRNKLKSKNLSAKQKAQVIEEDMARRLGL